MSRFQALTNTVLDAELDQLCVRLGLEPNQKAELLRGMAATARHLETTLQRYLHLYNQHTPQKNLGHVTLVAKLKEYCRANPALFQKRPIIHPGPDN